MESCAQLINAAPHPAPNDSSNLQAELFERCSSRPFQLTALPAACSVGRSAAMAQCVDQQSEGRGRLAAARVIQVVSWPRWTPIFKDPLETTLREVGPR